MGMLVIISAAVNCGSQPGMFLAVSSCLPREGVMCAHLTPNTRMTAGQRTSSI
jgi:hypothetical protein